MKKLLLITTMLFGLQAFAGFGGYSNTTQLGIFEWLKCSTGTTCTKQGDKMVIQSNGNNTISNTHFTAWPTPTLTSGTSTNGTSGTVYLSQINIGANVTLTGIALDNATANSGTSFLAVLYNSAGVVVANSVGAVSTGSSAWQLIPFTAPKAITGPASYWVGIIANNNTASFYTTPAVGAFAGLAGTVTGQTFAAINITPPTTFTAGTGPVVYTY